MTDPARAMYLAIAQGDSGQVKRLIQAGFDPNDVVFDAAIGAPTKRTALQEAALQQEVAITELLLEAGARVNVNTEHMAPPLHLAVLNANLDLCKLLLAAGANVNLPTVKISFTPLHYVACADMAGASEVCALLIASGALLDAVDGDGMTALHHAAVEPNRVNIVQQLLEAGAKPNLFDSFQLTPLHRAESGEIFGLLLDHKADLYATPPRAHPDYATPLNAGLACGHDGVVKLCQAILADHTFEAVTQAVNVPDVPVVRNKSASMGML